jgi:uncharacterized membrane protein
MSQQKIILVLEFRLARALSEYIAEQRLEQLRVVRQLRKEQNEDLAVALELLMMLERVASQLALALN